MEDYFTTNTKLVRSLRGRLIRFFSLKGSWEWAKKRMIEGKVVRCKHWSGSLTLKVDSSENQLLQCNYQGRNREPKWETSNHHLSYERFVDYHVVE